MNYTQWHDLKIRWVPDTTSATGWRTDWLVKLPTQTQAQYALIRSEKQASPNKWMTVRFNAWAPDGGFAVATDGVNPVSTNAAGNQSYYIDVDWVKVTQAAPTSLSVTEVAGVAVSNSGETVVPNLSVIKGQVSDSSGAFNMVNVVITRSNDGFKWQGSNDPNSVGTWVPGNQNVGTSTNYPNSQPNWTTNGSLPTGANLTNGSYTIKADAFLNGNFVKDSALVFVRIANSANSIPVSQVFGPTGGTTNVGDARASNAIYRDDDGNSDIAECRIRIRRPNNTYTEAVYNKTQDRLYLLDDNNSTLLGGAAPGSAGSISNSSVTLNYAATTVFVTNDGRNEVQVRWNFTPKTSLIGTNQIGLDVTDRAGAHNGFVYGNSAGNWTWTVAAAPSGNSAPLSVAFGPQNGNSQVGDIYQTNAISSDADGTNDLLFLMVVISKDDSETRVYYNAKTNLLYILNDARTAWMGGVAPGTQNQLTNNLITVDCFQTNVFRTTDSRNQVQVRWFFIAKSGLIGTNNISMQAFDTLTTSGLQPRGTWTVRPASAQMSSGITSAAASEKNSTSVDSSKPNAKTYTDENPYVGESPADPRTKNYPKKMTGDGTTGPPIEPISTENSSSSSSLSASSASTQKSAPDPSSERS